jgi:hypothetical protein
LFTHPGTVTNSTIGILGPLKPDIFDAFRQKYGEIKPLSFGGVGSGILQMAAYDRVYGPKGLGFTRLTDWPTGFQTVVVAGDWIVYFNVNGVIYYSDAIDDIEELSGIKDDSSAYRFLRQFAKRTVKPVIDFAKRMIRGTAGADEADSQNSVGVATLNAEMGAE